MHGRHLYVQSQLHSVVLEVGIAIAASHVSCVVVLEY